MEMLPNKNIMIKTEAESAGIIQTGHAINNGFVLISDENHISTN